MKNSERLELLKESAGTKVYEDKRAGSVKLLEETDGKRQKVDEVLGYIDERLKEVRIRVVVVVFFIVSWKKKS